MHRNLHLRYILGAGARARKPVSPSAFSIPVLRFPTPSEYDIFLPHERCHRFLQPMRPSRQRRRQFLHQLRRDASVEHRPSHSVSANGGFRLWRISIRRLLDSLRSSPHRLCGRERRVGSSRCSADGGILCHAPWLWTRSSATARLSFGHATGRFFAKMISGFTFGIGYVMAGFTERKQALHDMIAGTLVLRG